MGERKRRRGVVRRTAVVAVAATAATVLASCSSAGASGAATTPTAASSTAAHRSGPVAGAGAGADGTIGHAGRWLTDRRGRVVYLHGVNVVAKGRQTPAQEGFGAAEAAWLAANGFDVVRLGLTAAAVEPRPGVIDHAYLDSFVGTVHLLTSQGILVLIDLHQDGWGPTLGSDGFPRWMTITHGATNTHTPFPLYYLTNPAIQAAFQSLWDNDTGPGGVTLQARTTDIFSALAHRVKGDSGVIGWDLLNEPWPGTDYVACATGPDGCPSEDRSELGPFDTRMTGAVRSAGDHHLVFGEPWVLFNFGQTTTSLPLPGGDKNSGMSFHLYTTSPADEPPLLDNAVAWSKQTGGALLNTEFGATTDVAAIDRQVDELDGDLLPWIWWAFNQEIVDNLKKPPTGANLDTPVVDALVRPHPVLVAGTPTALHYDEVSHVLDFSYKTVGPTGKRFGPGSRTVLDVPATAYPDGAKVAVRGGRLVSQVPGRTATVAAAAGSKRVTVTITPSPTPTPTPSPAPAG